MATLVNIRIHTQSKAVPNAGYIAIDKVMMEGNTIVAMGGDVRYVLGVVPMENIVVDTPSAPEECGCNTTNANIFATLIKGVDGVTPDMSDYYDKSVIDEKLGKKQDVISDLDTIRSGASKGATAVQPNDIKDFVTEGDLGDVALTGSYNDLNDTPTFKTINGESIVGEGDISAIDFANDLTGVQETTAEEFMFRPSAGFRSIRDESAVIRRIKGNTTVWGQYAKNPNFADGMANWASTGATLSVNSNGGVNFVTTSSSSQSINQVLTDAIPKGHKVLIVIDYKRNTTTSLDVLFYLRKSSGGFDQARIYSVADSNRRVDSVIITTTDVIMSTTSSSLLVYPMMNGAMGLTAIIYSINAFDLTDLFGAGNEPTTIEAFREVYPDDYYPYCEPELRSMRATSIETVGFNLYNGDYAELIGGKTYYIGGTDKGILTFTPNGTTASEVIELGDDRTYTPISSGKLSSTYADICVHFQHSGIKDGECADYVEHMLELPEIAKYYPDGMNGIGKVYDEINAENAVKRFGVVDLGTLEWRIVGTANNVDKRIYSYGVSDVAKGTASTGVVGNIMCAKYNAISADQNYLRNRGISIAQTSKGVVLHIYDPSYNSDDKLSDFVASLQGVLLVYELAEPVVTSITEPLLLDYKVADFGTEKMLSDLPSSPFRADIVYQFNAEGRIRDNSRNIERLESIVDSVKEDISSAIETYIADFTMEELRQGVYEGVNVNCRMQSLINAMNANKVILVREGTDPAYKGVRVLNGYAEDLLYFSIVDVNGEIIYCDGADYIYNDSFIQGSSLYRRNFDAKQDTLVSGENIKTINGESILGSGDITVGGVSEDYVNNAIANAITNAINASY